MDPSACTASCPHPTATSKAGRRFLTPWLLLLALVAALSSASASTVFRHIAGDDTLPNGAIPTAVAEDREGFVWIGTQNGLARWDGLAYRTYRADPDNAAALPDNMVAALHQSRNGTLWIGTENAGLARYDPLTDHFETTTLPAAGAALRGIAAISDATGNHVWVATGGGLFELDEMGRIVTRLTAEALPDPDVNAVLQDRAGGLWVAVQEGLLRRAPGASAFAPVRLVSAMAADPSVLVLAEDRSGQVWAGTKGHGAYRIETAADGTPIAARPVPETQNRQFSENINAIETGLDRVWIGTSAGGLITVDPRTLAAIRQSHDVLSPASISDGSVMALHRDRAGLVWIATLHGIDQIDPGQRAITTLFGGRNAPGALSMADVMSVVGLPGGGFWAGGRTGEIDFVGADGTRSGGFRPEPSHPDTALAGGAIYDMAAGSAGVAGLDDNIYIAAGNRLYRADPGGTSVTHIPLADHGGSVRLKRVCRQGGTLWLGGPDGAWQYGLRPDAPPRLLRHLGAADLTDPRVVALNAAPDGTLWIGTRNGLNRLAPDAAVVERILPNRFRHGALSSAYISALVTDRRGRLWVGTSDRGIGAWDGRDAAGRPQFRSFGRADGLPDDGVDSLAVAQDGTLWAATDGGIAVIDTVRMTLRALRAADGVAIPSFWAGAAAMTQGGTIAFGGTAGLTLVQPDRLKPDTYRAPLAVTEIRVNGDPVWAGHRRPDGSLAPLMVPPGARSLSVSFASLDYSAPLLTRTAYRLDGFDSSWVTPDATSRTAAYTNLPPGHYVLRLRGSNRAGLWNEPGLAVPINVVPAWYQTVWFHAACACLAAAAMLLLLHARTHFLRLRQAELEILVAARTEELVKSQQKLREAAYCDLLTGLNNRRAFNEYFQTFVAATALGQHFALLLIDLDGFKLINDTIGHDAGDDILVVTADRLRGAVRECDIVARLGGDEFAILLAGSPKREMIALICDRLIETLAGPSTIKGISARVGASIGVALFPEHGGTQELLYKSADLALYDCKRAGRGVWRQFLAQAEAPSLHPVRHMQAGMSGVA